MGAVKCWGDDGWFWERFDPDDFRAKGDIALLRRSVYAQPGTVPAMWRLQRVALPTRVAASGFDNPYTTAEHHALTLFGMHQSGQTVSMHKAGYGLGRALGRLSAEIGTQRTEKLLTGFTTAWSVNGVAQRIRTFIPLLSKHKIGMDYSELLDHLYFWQRGATGRKIALRAWAGQYFPASPAETR